MSNKKKRNISGTEVKIRRAGMSDMADLYKWRNHPDVRMNSFNSDDISWEKHKEWFERVKKDPAYTIYIAYYGKDKIGSIRFDDKTDVTKVSVMLSPDFWGMGLGADVIRLGTARFIRGKKPAKKIVAEIKKDNVASVKSFKKAGFREGHTTYVLDLNEGVIWEKQ